ncbi:MAG: M48 family metalloprotease [Fibromonadaceae bacterium]|jgi:predicted Zn-dependent protease|nr:M48 family metalloprotease [Fibromonadaceae bacterium]
MYIKWKIFWVAALALVFLFQACVSSWQELVISTAEEKQMGREFDSLIRRQDPSVMQPSEKIWEPSGDAEQALYDFYQARGREVVKKIKEDDFKSILTDEKLCRNNSQEAQSVKVTCTKDNFFEFNIIKSNQVNAFAVPGGYVYFYTKILKQFKSESELIGVLGHEVGHVIKHHSRDRIVKQVGASAIIEALLGEGMGATLASLGTGFWLTSNGQKDESEADGVGFYFTNELGISSQGLGDFFARGLKSYDATSGTCNEKEESSVTDVFSTHPPSCKRVNDNTKRIKDAGQTLVTHPLNKDYNGKTFTELVSAASLP